MVYSKNFAYVFNPLNHVRLHKDVVSNINEWMQSKRPFWMHVEKPSKNLESKICKSLSIPKAARLILFAPEVRSRFVKVDKGFVFVIHSVQSSNMALEEDFPTLRLWITHDSVLSIASKKIQSIDDLHQLLKDPEVPDSDLTPMYCLTNIIDCIIDYLEEVIYQLDEKLYKVESQFQCDDATITKITNIRQDIIYLRRYVNPQRDALINLASKLVFASGYSQTLLKELSDGMQRQVESIEMLRERAVVMQDNLTNQIGEISNRRMYLLTLIMLIFTPAFFIMGLFSESVSIPGMNNPYAWWGINISIVVTSYLLYKILKAKKWL